MSTDSPAKTAHVNAGTRIAAGWLAVAVASLVLAGVFALVLVVGRLPGIDTLLGDGSFFHRGLVIHVNLSLVVWFYAFVAALFWLLPSHNREVRWGKLAIGIATFGIIVLLAAFGLRGAEPVLSNYVPAIDHPLFLVALVLFFGGVALGLLGSRLWGPADESAPSLIPPAARPPLKAAAVAFFLALTTVVATYVGMPGSLPPISHYEMLFWGGGHVLQFASVAAMLAVWMMLVEGASGQPVLGRKSSAVLFGLYVMPLFAAPLVSLVWGGGPNARLFFTRLMQLGMAPTVVFVLLACLRALARVGSERATLLRDARVWAFAASAILTLLGFVLGLLISGSNTLVPAHYHANIGAVTASFMGITYTLLEPLGLRVLRGRLLRLSRWQPLLFGIGQLVFATGFAMAGAHGMARKAYGAENVAARMHASGAGLVVMGTGGMVAVAGGLTFLGIVVWSFVARRRVRRTTWRTEIASTLSKH